MVKVSYVSLKDILASLKFGENLRDIIKIQLLVSPLF